MELSKPSSNQVVKKQGPMSLIYLLSEYEEKLKLGIANKRLYLMVSHFTTQQSPIYYKQVTPYFRTAEDYMNLVTRPVLVDGVPGAFAGPVVENGLMYGYGFHFDKNLVLTCGYFSHGRLHSSAPSTIFDFGNDLIYKI